MIALTHAHDGDQACVSKHVDTGVRQFDRAAVGVPVHRREFLLRDVLHPHTARVEREALGFDRLTRPQHGRNLRLHRRVRARYDLPNTEGTHFVSLS